MAKQAGRLRKLLRRVLRFKGIRKLLRVFKGCPKRATWQFRSLIETACGALGGPMAKQAGRLGKLLRRVLRFKGLRKFLPGF